MNNLIHYSHCPVCTSPDIKNVLTVKDYTVSGETFYIAECGSCSLRFTQDVPGAVSILPYYKTEQYISHSNTSKGLINRLYQFVRKRTMVKKRKLIEKYTGLKKGSLLDVGSGIGTFVNEMKQNGWNAMGLEPDEDARQLARQLYQLDLADTREFCQLSPDSFDAITLWHVLEHIHDLTIYIQQLKAVLNKKGKLFVAVPNYTSLDAKIYQEYWAAYDVPRHLYHFSPKSIKLLMEKNALKVVQYKPMWYDSFYISLLSSKYKNASQLPARQSGVNWLVAFWNGLRSNLKAMGNVKKCSSIIYVIEKPN